MISWWHFLKDQELGQSWKNVLGISCSQCTCSKLETSKLPAHYFSFHANLLFPWSLDLKIDKIIQQELVFIIWTFKCAWIKLKKMQIISSNFEWCTSSKRKINIWQSCRCTCTYLNNQYNRFINLFHWYLNINFYECTCTYFSSHWCKIVLIQAVEPLKIINNIN